MCVHRVHLSNRIFGNYDVVVPWYGMCGEYRELPHVSWNLVDTVETWTQTPLRRTTT